MTFYDLFSNFKEAVPPPKKKLYISDNAHLMVRHAAKFCAVTPVNPKVIKSHTLHFKPIFDLPL